jgi:hypothetical protein
MMQGGAIIRFHISAIKLIGEKGSPYFIVKVSDSGP